MSSSLDDPNLKWDAARGQWIRWNGSSWVDSSTGEAIGGQVANAPAQPLYGSGRTAPQMPKQKHTARNVVLIILGLFVLGVGGCTVLIFAGAKGAVDSANKAEASSSAAATASCVGMTYLDSQAANDTCADAAGTINVEGTSITATPLAPAKNDFGGKSLCSTVTFKNASGKSQDYNSFNFKIQTPSGDVATTSTIGSFGANGLNSGTLVNGGTKTGSICSDYTGAAGQWVMIYDPSPFTDPRGIWLTTVK